MYGKACRNLSHCLPANVRLKRCWICGDVLDAVWLNHQEFILYLVIRIKKMFLNAVGNRGDLKCL